MLEKIAIICGGQSTEHVVSRMSTTSVLKNINKNKYDLTIIGIDKDGTWYNLDNNITDLTKDNWLDNSEPINDIMGTLKSQSAIIAMLHGLYGEDGTIQGLFELANVPYVGCKVLGSSLAMDKVYAKKVFASANIPQAKYIYVKRRYDNTLVVVDDDFNETTNITNTVKEKLGFPCFVKASNSGSSVGCYKVNKEEELLTALLEASEYDRKILIEEYIDCIELECAALGNDDPIISRVGQIMPHGEFYTFESKYEDEQSSTVIPALVDKSIQEKVRELALKAYKSIDGHGLSRIDFFLDKRNNNLYLNEVNTLPGFTTISMYPELIQDTGYSYSEMLDELIKYAKEK